MLLCLCSRNGANLFSLIFFPTKLLPGFQSIYPNSCQVFKVHTRMNPFKVAEEILSEEAINELQNIEQQMKNGDEKRARAKETVPYLNSAEKKKKKAENDMRCKMYRKTKSEEKKAADRANDRARKAKRKAELKNSNPEEHRRKMDEANRRKRLNRGYNKDAQSHNIAYPFDMVPDKQHDKPTYKLGGTYLRNKIFLPPRVTTLRQDLHVIRDALGKDGEGHFAEVTESSLMKVQLEVFSLLGRDVRCRNLYTLDLGSGMLMPSLVFSQYLFEHGFHVGIEFQQNLVALSKYNLRNYSLKGMANIQNGLFEETHIKTKGELTNVLPPRVDCVHGDIVSVCVFVCLCVCANVTDFFTAPRLLDSHHKCAEGHRTLWQCRYGLCL